MHGVVRNIAVAHYSTGALHGLWGEGRAAWPASVFTGVLGELDLLRLMRVLDVTHLLSVVGGSVRQLNETSGLLRSMLLQDLGLYFSELWTCHV